MSRTNADDILEGIREIATQDEEVRREEVTKIIDAVWGIFRDNAGGLERVLPVILDLSIHCPFTDVRERFAELLKGLDDTGACVPYATHTRASSFMVSCGSSNAQNLEVEHRVKEAVFLLDYKVSNLVNVMSKNPEHAEAFHATSREIFVCDGPLPVVERHYIAILAAAQHRCLYLYDTHRDAFLGAGGDEAWLDGLTSAPAKFADLCELNGLLAFQPWRVTKDHIQALLRGENSWSLSELIQCIVVMVSVHAVSSFVYGIGVNRDIALEGGHSYDKDPHRDGDSKVAEKSETGSKADGGVALWPVSDEPWEARILGKLKRPKAPKASEDLEADDAVVEAKNKIHFQDSETESWNTATSKKASSIWDRFVCGQVQHEDFDVSSKEYSIFRSQDYTWADHGFAVLEQYHGKIASLLDHEFRVIRNMTDKRFGEETDVDTSKFRRAIWYYSQRIYGVCHDDYDYSEVNNYLERPLKQFVKKLICAPELMTSTDFDNFGRHGLACHEKIHIASLAWEARREAALSYALHAIMKNRIN